MVSAAVWQQSECGSNQIVIRIVNETIIQFFLRKFEFYDFQRMLHFVQSTIKNLIIASTTKTFAIYDIGPCTSSIVMWSVILRKGTWNYYFKTVIRILWLYNRKSFRYDLIRCIYLLCITHIICCLNLLFFGLNHYHLSSSL